MLNIIITQLARLKERVPAPFSARFGQKSAHDRFNLRELAANPDVLPSFVQESLVAMRYLHLLGAIDWASFPERNLETKWGYAPIPYTAFAAACLVKLDQGIVYMSRFRTYLVEHPALTWILGFPLVSAPTPWGFDTEASLPSARHLTRMLREIPNTHLQFLLDETLRLLQAELATKVDDFGESISLDTKHIVAWVKENNPKAYVNDRYKKDKQPAGDPDCKLGCKRRRNLVIPLDDPLPTPPDNPVSARNVSVGEYYWGYASGVVATKVPGWGEFVLAEFTQPFNKSDVSYFFPLMEATERRLGFRPHFGAFDGGFDGFYIYEYFHRDGQPIAYAFAAVPFAERGGKRRREFDPDGLPLCPAGRPMPLKSTFMNRTSFIEHERGRYVCPLLYPEQIADCCPIDHDRWADGGCLTTLPTSIGARIRYQLDRESELYKDVYKQRTATERINSQAVDLGIERPKLRNGQAIANQNTLIYVLINLRALNRVRQQKAEKAVAPVSGS
jgi:hypothetical protein